MKKIKNKIQTLARFIIKTIKLMEEGKKQIHSNSTKYDKKTETKKNRPLIFPGVCGVCGKLSEEYLCKKCELLLKKEADLTIEKYDKTSNHSYFCEHIYFFKYKGIIRDIIIDYKFNEKSYLYKTIVNFLLKNEKIFEILKSYDTIVPVPVSKKRKKERGYNQCLLIVRELSNLTGIEFQQKCLLKTKDVVAQSKLNRENRMKNIQGAYELKNAYLIENKNILLFDDIYTTGSTVKECCKTLKQAKINKIGILTIAKD